MSDLKVHALRLARRLGAFKDAARVRDAAKGIAYTVRNEVEVLLVDNKRNGLRTNEGPLEWIAGGAVPRTRAKQQDWLDRVIDNLNILAETGYL